jgi:hypothetical protein
MEGRLPPTYPPIGLARPGPAGFLWDLWYYALGASSFVVVVVVWRLRRLLIGNLCSAVASGRKLVVDVHDIPEVLKHTLSCHRLAIVKCSRPHVHHQFLGSNFDKRELTILCTSTSN